MRNYSKLDSLILFIDQCFDLIPFQNLNNTLKPKNNAIPPTIPPNQTPIAQFMRINHSGELAAQGLYLGQALFAQKYTLQTHLILSAIEEQKHLFWCSNYLFQINSRSSYLGLMWFLGAYSVGCLAGLKSDIFSLGFIAETERQVAIHLENQLYQINAFSNPDPEAIQILKNMQQDELAHADQALHHGGTPYLSSRVQFLMLVSSKLMIYSSKYI